MIASPGVLRQFAAHERKGAEICMRLASRHISGFAKRHFSKSAADHDEQADAVEEFLEGNYHDEP